MALLIFFVIVTSCIFIITQNNDDLRPPVKVIRNSALIATIALAGCETTKTSPQPPAPNYTCWDGSIVESLNYCPASPVGASILKPSCIGSKSCTDIDVFFGTTRKTDWDVSLDQDGSVPNNVSPFFEELKTQPEKIELGVLKVTVPKDASRQQLDIRRPRAERGFGIFKIRAETLDSNKHYTLYDYEVMDESNFKNNLGKSNSAFIYIHGYKEDAEIAAFKAAQIAVKGEYTGVPAIFTWPSLEKTTPKEYKKARKIARDSAKGLADFIDIVSSSIQSEEVHIIAHSMGNHVLLEAMQHLDDDFLQGNSLGEVMLAAPDIATSSYLDFVSESRSRFQGITLYSSGKDITLEISQNVCRAYRASLEEKGRLSFNERQELRNLRCGTRAGYSKADSYDPLTVIDADTIDSSQVKESMSFLNVGAWHSYPFTDSKLLNDMAFLMKHGTRKETYERPNISCLSRTGTKCISPKNPPTDHYFTIK